MYCDVSIYDRYDTIRYDTIRYDTIRYDTIRYDTIRYDTIRYDTIRYDTIRYDTIRYDTIRYDTIRYDTIRYDTIRYDTIHFTKYNRPLLYGHPGNAVTSQLKKMSIFYRSNIYCNVVSVMRSLRYSGRFLTSSVTDVSNEFPLHRYICGTCKHFYQRCLNILLSGTQFTMVLNLTRYLYKHGLSFRQGRVLFGNGDRIGNLVYQQLQGACLTDQTVHITLRSVVLTCTNSLFTGTFTGLTCIHSMWTE